MTTERAPPTVSHWRRHTTPSRRPPALRDGVMSFGPRQVSAAQMSLW